MVVLFNLLTDLLYVVVDPRVEVEIGDIGVLSNPFVAS
jgi:hypothetical protein